MADYNHTPIASGYNTTSSINNELQKVETAVASKLDDNAGVLTGDLDANSRKLLNVADGTDAGDGVNYAQLVDKASMQVADAKFYDTVLLAQSDTTLVAGDVIIIKERASAIFDVISGTGTANTYDIIAHGSLSLSFSLRITTPISVEAFGNDSGAISAMDGKVKWAIFTNANTIITTPIVFNNGIKLTGAEGHRITPRLGLAGGKLFNFLADDIHVEGLNIDATGETFTPATGNTYAFFSGDGATKYYRHKYIGNKITNLSFSDGNIGSGPPTNLLVSHAFYADNVEDVVIDSNTVDGVSGSCVFLRDTVNIHGHRNKFKAFRWYALEMDSGVTEFSFNHNQFLSTTTEGAYWGGAINTVSDFSLPAAQKVKRGQFKFNHLEGNYAYGAVIRIQSADDIEVAYNTAEGLGVGTIGAGGDLTGIRVLTRGTDASNKQEPCHRVYIHHNSFEGPSGTIGKRHYIYVDNDYWTANPSTDIKIQDNSCFSPDATNYWEDGIIVHGLSGGVERVEVYDNYIETRAASSPTVNGSIGFTTTDINGAVKDVTIGGNTVKEMGTASASYHLGIGFGADLDNVLNTRPNILDGHFYGVRTLTGAGPTLEKIDDNIYKNIVSLNELYSVQPSRFGKGLVGSKTFDPPSLAANTSAYWTDITVTGVVVGQPVHITFSLDQAGIELIGYVRVANSVRVYARNHTGGAVDLASGTITATVQR